jgi:chromosome segregation ATPase
MERGRKDVAPGEVVDWLIVEKLAPSLAWPIVALIMFLVAMPFIYKRFGKLIEAILALRDLPKTLQDSMKEHERLTLAIKEHFSTANKDIDQTAQKVQALIGDLAAIRNELQTYQTETQTDALAADSKSIELALGPADATTLEVNKSTAEMYVTAMGKWVVFTNALERRLKELGIEYDVKNIGVKAFELTDRRRRGALTPEEAALIKKLASQARRFTKLADTKDEWLSAEVYLGFVNGVDVASKAIARHKTNGATAPVGQ